MGAFDDWQHYFLMNFSACRYSIRISVFFYAWNCLYSPIMMSLLQIWHCSSQDIVVFLWDLWSGYEKLLLQLSIYVEQNESFSKFTSSRRRLVYIFEGVCFEFVFFIPFFLLILNWVRDDRWRLSEVFQLSFWVSQKVFELFLKKKRPTFFGRFPNSIFQIFLKLQKLVFELFGNLQKKASFGKNWSNEGKKQMNLSYWMCAKETNSRQ